MVPVWLLSVDSPSLQEVNPDQLCIADAGPVEPLKTNLDLRVYRRSGTETTLIGGVRSALSAPPSGVVLITPPGLITAAQAWTTADHANAGSSLVTLAATGLSGSRQRSPPLQTDGE